MYQFSVQKIKSLGQSFAAIGLCQSCANILLSCITDMRFIRC